MSEKIDSKEFDVIIIGAGPAGGSTARELSKLGKKILLIEKSQEIGQPNYSTAGTLKETIKEFDLPDEVISASWDKIIIASSKITAKWEFPETMGYVFDFAKLRKFLAEDAIKNGAEILVGTTVTDITEENGIFTKVHYHSPIGDGEVKTKFIIDATGHNEFANTKFKINNIRLESFTEGMEYQVVGLVPELQNTLAFYIGSQYAPNGYAWSFPMKNGVESKIGICRYGEKLEPNLNKLLEKFMSSLSYFKNIEPLELHAGAAHIDGGVKNHVYKNLILVGDSAHQINPIAGEGIRHSLIAGRIAALTVNEALNSNNLQNLKEKYEKKWNDKFGKKWKLSLVFADIIYHKLNDSQLDQFIELFQKLPPNDVFEFGFHYNYQVLLKHPIITTKLSRFMKEFIKALINLN